MSDQNDLASRIIHYLEQQHAIYGDFDLTELDLKPVQNELIRETDLDSKKIAVSPDITDKLPSSLETHAPRLAAEKKKAPALSLKEQLQACTTLEKLQELCEQASELRTDLADTKLVFGTGNPNADLMIIGEAPGEQEDRQGEPFVGKAGQLLTKILQSISFERDQVYITNILKHRPPNNRDPLPEERSRSLPYLFRQIKLVRPKIILCLGRISAQTLLSNDASMKEMRGKFHKFYSIELMVTYHPAALLRNPQWKRSTWHDVQMLRKRYNELGCTP